MRSKHISIFILLAFVMIIAGCNKDDTPDPDSDYVYDPTPLELDIPEWFPDLVIPSDNPLTVEGVKLGRMLYYDPLLHKNTDQACADCHIQDNSFSSAGEVLPHLNLGWNSIYLWNGKIQGTLEDIMLFEVSEFFEMDVPNFQNHGDYPELFYNAFGTDQVTHELAAKAMSQFQRTMISVNSAYDKVVAGTRFFTDDELEGFDIFNTEKGDCFHCHGGILFTDNQMHNNGLDANPDEGYSEITGNNLDIGKFKAPTLRNVTLTAPYMHDGRYQTLEEVVDFYSEGLQFSATIDPLMKNVHKGGVQLTEEEKGYLVAFLRTLTDMSYTQNPELSNPFN